MISIPEELNPNQGIPGWLELDDLSLHGDMVARIPKGAYVKGMIGGEKPFFPISEMLGTAISKPEGVNSNHGWVELETLTFHRDIEAVAPIPPYVRGEMDENNNFYPDKPYTIVRSNDFIGNGEEQFMTTQAIEALVNTVIKKYPIDSTQITDPRQKFTLLAGSKLEIQQYDRVDHNHWKLVLSSPVNGSVTWFAYSPHVNILRPNINRSTMITYQILNDENGKLKASAKLACNFWNRFVIPQHNIVIRLGTFYSPGSVIARAYKPYKEYNAVYGKIEFNTKYLGTFTNYGIAGTIIHEIGHTLGFGWDQWMNLFHQNTGAFKPESIKKIPELQYMFVETDYGPGTIYSHWDEERFDQELMTGFKDTYEYVLPVTIKVMALLGHVIAEELTQKTALETLIREIEDVLFTMTETVQEINFQYDKDTEISEEIYTTLT